MRKFIATKVGGGNISPDRTPPRPSRHQAHRWSTSAASIVTGVPAVMLTTIGAKSGEPRTVAVYGIPHPEGLAVIASNFGGAKHPAWYHNLKANPHATVSVEGDTWDAVARVAPTGERDEIYANGVEIYPGWRKYEITAGERHIEAFVLVRS